MGDATDTDWVAEGIATNGAIGRYERGAPAITSKRTLLVTNVKNKAVLLGG